MPGYTAVEENIFAIQETYFELLTMKPNVRFEMHFEINRDERYVTRYVFTLLQALGEVGGLLGLLTAFAALLDSFLTHHDAENYLIGMLYKGKGKENRLIASNAIVRYLLCRICTRKGKLMVEAREQLSKELDLVYLLRQLRFVNAAIFELLHSG